MKTTRLSVRDNPQHHELCQQLALRLGVPLVERNDDNFDGVQLEVAADSSLRLRSHTLPDAPLRLDFDVARNRASNADPLLKAVGTRARTVVDATAGWCEDALHFARHGLQVAAVEKNLLVATLLFDAHATCRDAALKARLRIIHDDSIAYLRALTDAPDVVYLDPMYPTTSKSAASKKPLTLLRLLAAPLSDHTQLFDAAMSCAKQRVVVKRPHRAPPIHDGQVGQISGRLVRFDIYQPTAK